MCRFHYCLKVVTRIDKFQTVSCPHYSLKVVMRMNWFCAIFLSSLKSLSWEWLHLEPFLFPQPFSSREKRSFHRKEKTSIQDADFGAGSPPAEIWRRVGREKVPSGGISCWDFCDHGKQTESRTPCCYCCLPCFLLWDRECSRLVLEGFKREQTGDPGKKKVCRIRPRWVTQEVGLTSGDLLGLWSPEATWTRHSF